MSYLLTLSGQRPCPVLGLGRGKQDQQGGHGNDDPIHEMEKAMATQSKTLAWKIPWTVEPGGLPSMGSHRVGHD